MLEQARGTIYPPHFPVVFDFDSEGLRVRRIGIGSAVILSACCQAAMAQTTYTDATQAIATALAAHGLENATVTYGEVVKYQECHPTHGSMRTGQGGEGESCQDRQRTETRTRVEQRLLSVGPLSLTFLGPATFGKMEYVNLPSDIIETSQNMVNCSKLSANTNVSLSISVARSHSITLTKSVSHTMGGQIGASASMFGIGVNASINMSDSESTATANADSSTNTYTINGSGSVSIPPKTRVIASFRAYKIEGRLPFTILAIVDGDLSQNDKGLRKLSEVIPAEQRTFTISGVLTSGDVSKADIVYFDSPIDGQCPGDTGLNGTAFTPSTNQKMVLSKVKSTNAVITGQRSPDADEVKAVARVFSVRRRVLRSKLVHN